MKVMLVSMQDDYGDPARGYSYEYRNFQNFLEGVAAGDEIGQGIGITEFKHYDFARRAKEIGVGMMSAEMYGEAKEYNPDFILFVLFNETLNPRMSFIKMLTSEGFKTIHWGCDDDYRWESFTKPIAKNFWGMATTYWQIYHQMKEMGINAHKTQWAANPRIYHPLELTPEERLNKTQVLFYGHQHTNRRAMLDHLHSSGIDVKVIGYDSKIASERDLVREIGNSAIVLNPSMNQNGMQIKGRHFETPACGSFQMSDWLPDVDNCPPYGEVINPLDAYFKGNIDMGLWSYGDFDSLAGKIKFFLDNPSLREEMCARGYIATMRSNTWVDRFIRLVKWVKEGNAECCSV